MRIKTNGDFLLDVDFNANMTNSERLVFIGFYDITDEEYISYESISYESVVKLRDGLNNLIQQKEDFDKKEQEQKQKEMVEKINQYEQLKKELQEYGYLK
jgi:hypothetical protein